MKNLLQGIFATMEPQMDIGHLFNNPEKSDLHFIVNNETIFAHRFVLESKTEYFKSSKFTSPTINSNGVLIVHPEASRQTVMAMLRFFYTNEFSIDFNYAAELMHFALKFQMEDLRKICASHISNQVTMDNVIDLYISASTFKVNGLKKACLQIIKENYNSISQSESFKKLLRYPELQQEIRNLLPGTYQNHDLLNHLHSTSVALNHMASTSSFYSLSSPSSHPATSPYSHDGVSSASSVSPHGSSAISNTNNSTALHNIRQASLQQFNVGSRCNLFGMSGTVRYFGKTSFDQSGNYWIGLETDLPVGQHDGMVQSVRYFNSKPNHGVFIGVSLI